MAFFDSLKNLLPEPELPSAEEADKQDASPFRQYDVRGTYPTQVSETLARALGRAYVRLYGPQRVAVGQDSRSSSPSLARALATQFLTLGIDVIDLGLCTTPFTAWVARKKSCDTIMVTASHNPPEQNGFKLYSAKTGEPISQETGLEELERAVIEEQNVTVPRARKERGKVQRKEVWKDEYKKEVIAAGYGTKRPQKMPRLRIAVDYSSGTVALTLNDILTSLGVSFDTLNEKPDGTFPGHGPNPGDQDAWGGIAHLIKTGRYHGGAIFDADGDRVVFFNEAGERIEAGVMGALFTHQLLPQTSGWKNIVVTTSLGRIARETAKEVGGRAHVVPVGRTNVFPAMKKHRALLGIEGSGHYFFKDFDYFDSGAVALLTLLTILSKEDKKLSVLTEPFDRYETLPEKALPYEEGTEERVLRTLRRHFSGISETVDGLSVSFKTWWFTIRRSHTEPVWRLTVEGKDKDTLIRKQKEIEAIVKNIKDLTK